MDTECVIGEVVIRFTGSLVIWKKECLVWKVWVHFDAAADLIATNQRRYLNATEVIPTRRRGPDEHALEPEEMASFRALRGRLLRWSALTRADAVGETSAGRREFRIPELSPKIRNPPSLIFRQYEGKIVAMRWRGDWAFGIPKHSGMRKQSGYWGFRIPIPLRSALAVEVARKGPHTSDGRQDRNGLRAPVVAEAGLFTCFILSWEVGFEISEHF